MNVRQFASVALAFLFLGTILFWNPVVAEEVVGQEKDINLYLYSENGVGKLHTRETGGHGDAESVNIPVGSSYFFALNFSLQSDLESKSYRTDVGFHIYLYANSANFNTGHLNIYVRDGTTMTGGELIATGGIDVPSVLQGNNEGHVDIFWEDDYGPTHQFDMERFIVLELENDGDNAINLELDTGKDGDSPSRLIATTNPVTDIEITTESYNLETSDLNDLMPTDNFQPNLPVDFSKVFVSAQALNAFGTYDIKEFKVIVFDSDDNELFVGNTEIEEPDDNSGINFFDDLVWNYNDPAEPSENHNGKGIYTIRVAAIDQQGNEFYLDKSVQMDAYGIYSYTSQTQQSVPVGGDVSYQILVRNSGDENDKFTIEPSETSDNWVVSPQTWTSNTLSPGDEQLVTFTVSAAAVCSANNAVAYTVVAGGGGGGGDAGGGGGAGGFREGTTAPVVPYTASPLVAPAGITVTAQAYPIVVGGGGPAGAGQGPTSPNAPQGSKGGPGVASTFSTITSAGGGGGAKEPTSPSPGPNDGQGLPGGSGGGGSYTAPGKPLAGLGGTGNTPPVSPPQGNAGGAGPIGTPSSSNSSSGGGGATAAGTGTTPSGAGGAGVTTHISGSPVAYAGGGGGAGGSAGPAGAGGTGGGGAGGDTGNPGNAGTINRGGGGGGGFPDPQTGGGGGSGIVILRYRYQ